MNKGLDLRTLPLSERFLSIGVDSRRPFTIQATTTATALGDLIGFLVYAASAKAQFDHCLLHLHYRDTKPYCRDLVRMVPDIDRAAVLGGEYPAWLRRHLPDHAMWRRPMAPLGRKLRPHWDLILSDAIADSRTVHAFADPVRLRVPPDEQPAVDQRLIALGLDPDRWFAVIHYRASSYMGREKGGEERDSDPRAFDALCDHIIDRLGGQIVRLGHPELVPFRPRPGLVDLAHVPDSFMLQAGAVSRARFMIGGPSGAVFLGYGFGIPSALVDAVDALGGWGSCHQVILTHEVTASDGQRLRNRSLLESGLLSRDILKKRMRAGTSLTVRKASGAELAKVADHMIDNTPNVTAWRTVDGTLGNAMRPNRLILPPQTDENLEFLDL